MKKTILILVALAFIASSCKQTTKKERATETTGNEVISEEKEQSIPAVPPIIQFDWGKVAMLKNSTIEQLKKKTESEDKIVMDFLGKYRQLTNQFTNILSANENIKFIEEDFYETGGTNPQVLNLQNEVETNGMKLKYDPSAGEIYLDVNSSFIKSGILPLVNHVSAEYINLYCHELDSTYIHDGFMYMSKEEMVRRVYQWGELSKKVADLEYKDHTERQFSYFLRHLFYGAEVEEEPTFDDETKKYNKKAIDFISKTIEKYPTSRAAAEFKPFLELLEKENFERTQNVEDYWKWEER